METFADRLKAAMNEQGLKQVDLVRLAQQKGIKLGKSHVSQYVSGKTIPRTDILHFLADALQVDPDWLNNNNDNDSTLSDVDKMQTSADNSGGMKVREFKKSSKLNNVLYDVRGPVVDEAARMEEMGTHVLKLNIGNPAPFGFRTPDEVIYDMSRQLSDCEGYSASAKSNIFIQSMVPELTELTFYYMNLVTVSRVQRNPTVKAEIQQRNFEASIPVGFFCYPISQAADITAFRATTVPVGEDQLPMLEQCKEIVHKFNSVYGETLTEPDIILPSNKACLRLPGIDGKAKMSKSLGNCIYLSDEAEDIKKKVMSMFTDPNHLRVEDPGQVEGNPVFIYLDAFCKQEYVDEFLPDYANLEELKEHYKRGGLGDVKVKKFLNNVMQAELAPIRERRKSWEKRLPDVYDILKEGSKVAEAKAAETLRDVKNSMKINYFEDPDFLK